MLDTIISGLKQYPLNRIRPEQTELGLRAAVLVALTGDPSNPEVILTRRAEHLQTHSGEVAFPGGKWELDDPDLLHTALRESEEEIGLLLGSVTPIATLPYLSPKMRTMRVTPYVGLVEQLPPLRPDPTEIESVFLAPLSIFTQQNNYAYFDLDVFEQTVSFPYLDFNDFRIWGFTLRVLTELLETTLGVQLDLQYPGEEQLDRLRRLEGREASDDPATESFKPEKPL